MQAGDQTRRSITGRDEVATSRETQAEPSSDAKSLRGSRAQPLAILANRLRRHVIPQGWTRAHHEESPSGRKQSGTDRPSWRFPCQLAWQERQPGFPRGPAWPFLRGSQGDASAGKRVGHPYSFCQPNNRLDKSLHAMRNQSDQTPAKNEIPKHKRHESVTRLDEQGEFDTR